MTFFPTVESWRIPESAMVDSLHEMARDGAAGNEGIALWLGRRHSKKAEVTHLVALRGPGVLKQPDLLIVESWLLNDVADVTIELGVTLVGQIHSHGDGYSTDLSFTDRRYGIAVPYYLSLVAPDYAMKEGTGIADCGVHVFEPGVGYRCLLPVEIAQRIHIVSGPRLPMITVGG